MQSKTSFFNPAVFRKNLTRFAPIWGGYTLCMVLALIIARSSVNDYNIEFRIVGGFAQLIIPLVLVNAAYALVVAQALFGDLYNSRSCYALHAMPLRREAWFVTNAASGLLYAVVPQILLCLLMIPMTLSSCVVGGWQIPFYLLGASVLQYLFFYGLAVFCTFCAGNRLGMVGIYGMLNFGALVLGLLVEAIYSPLLFGVILAHERYDFLSPIASMMGRNIVEFENFYDLKRVWEEGDQSVPLQVHFEAVPDTWAYYGICALIGAALLIVAIQLYRKRDLECAGDLLAFRGLRTVFLVVFTVLVGAAAQLGYAAFSAEENYGYFVFLAVGVVVGWFVGIMLLERTTRVFRKKNCVGVIVVALAYALSLGLTWLDPMGIEDWIPEKEEVASIHFDNWATTRLDYDNPADIDQLLELHRLALEQHLESTNWQNRVLREGVTEEEATEDDYRYSIRVALDYTLKNGKKSVRQYNVWTDSEAGDIVKNFLSSPEAVMAPRYSGDEFKLEETVGMTVNGKRFNDYLGDLDSLWAALLADCNEGNMAFGDYFHTGVFQLSEDDENRYGREDDGIRLALDISLYSENDSFYVSVFPDSAHTMQWLTDRGILEALDITVLDERPAPKPVD